MKVMAKTLASFTISMAILLFSVPTGSAGETHQYYRHIELDGSYNLVGRYPVDKKDANSVNCYRFTYDEDGRLIKVEYTKGGRLAIDPYFEVAQIILSMARGGR